MLPQQVVLIGSALIFVGSISYIRDTVRGKNKPNRVTWLMWAISPLIAATISWNSGSSFWAGLPIFMGGFMPLLIFIATFFNQQSYWKLSVFDYICGLCSLLALFFWLFASAPITALLLAILGDIAAGLPTIRKSWIEPESESMLVYILSGISMLLGLFILPSWTFVNSAFLWAMLGQGVLIISFILTRSGKVMVDKKP